MKKYIILAIILFAVGIGVVSAQTPAQDPIVIIPGTIASFNADIIFDPTPTVSTEGWKFAPGVNQYDQLIQSFLDAGLVENKDFFVAFYDWRQRNDDSATNYLIPVIDKALANSSTGKVDIVAHSMGGLVARSYIQGSAYRGDVDQFIMLGTPNSGSSDVYTLWEGGLIPDNWSKGQRKILGGFLWYMKWRTIGTPTNYETIHQYLPSIQELLPTYDYLSDKDTNNTIPVASMQDRNLFLTALNLESNKSNMLMGVQGGISIIAGNGESTVGNIPVTSQTIEDGSLWADGKPVPLAPVRNDTQGDNRVLLSSAFMNIDMGGPLPVLMFESTKNNWFSSFVNLFAPIANAQIPPPTGDIIAPPPFTVNSITKLAKHGELPTKSIPEIFSILGMGTPLLTYEPIPEPDAILTFWFASPIDVKIISPSGNITTKTISDISGATYTGVSNPLGFKMVTIENPEVGKYTVELLGLADGEYHMGVGSFTDGGDTTITVGGSVIQDQHLAYSVQYDPVNIQNPTKVSEPFELELTTEQLFEKFRLTLNKMEVDKHLQRRLLKDTDKAERAYIKGDIRKTQSYLKKINKEIEKTTEKEKYRLSEEDGNSLIEIVQEIKNSLPENKESNHKYKKWNFKKLFFKKLHNYKNTDD